MTRKNITVIAALAAVVVCVGVYLFLTQSKIGKDWVKSLKPGPSYDFSNYPESPRLTDFDSNKLNRIENRGEGYSLVRNGDTWTLTSSVVPVNLVKLDQSIISNKLWSISSIYAEELIEDNPADLTIYGLDNPYGDVLLGDTDGKSVEIIFGNFTPTKASRYVMVAGSPNVYSLSTYSTDNLLFSLDSVRDKTLIASLDPQKVTRFILEPKPDNNPNGYGKIDIATKDADNVYISSFTGFTMSSPYADVCGVDSEKFGAVLDALPNLQIRAYVDDTPGSLASYGLDKPGRVYFETPDGKLDILFGNSDSGAYYARYNGDPSIFLLEGLDPIISPSPFSLMDKFAMIFNIDNVDAFTVEGDGQKLDVTIDGKGDDAIFHVNGKRAMDKEFRAFYQAVIGLLIDAEYTGPANPPRGDGTDWTIQYKLNTPAGVQLSIRLIPYNRDFYILERDGHREFMIARTQARRIFDTEAKLVYTE
ncbi:MAG: DUF4340 domain-containing protein [Treponema sp.]|nr:DUF4340 domain-containing protein [Treponema sp.]